MKAPEFPVEVLRAGDQAFLVAFGADISLETHLKVRSFSDRVRALRGFQFLSIQPAYASVLLKFDPLKTSSSDLHDALVDLASEMDQKTLALPPTVLITIPVCYDDPFAPDMAHVVTHTGLSRDEVIRRHSQASYHAYFLGFLPGFAYLGGLPAELSTPRLASARRRVPPGSVGIAGGQTGIYPLDSPGGWRLIGRTPLTLFDGRRNPPGLISMGQDVRFEPISIDEYKRLGGKWDS